MTQLCHYIAFASTVKSDKTADIQSDVQINRKNKEDSIKQLYALTDRGRVPKQIASLAESFGFMLVKLDVWELKQKSLIDELKKQNQALETAHKQLGEQNRSLVVSLREKYSPAQFVGQCSQMQKVKQMALNIAQRPINTLLLGDSGTGKEVFAKIIHFNSPRADKVFLAVNCTAIAESLFESEMFGIEKGIATGVSKRKGYFEQAHTGTIFLDEIGDMSLVNQAKLLRVIEEQEVMRVGGSAPIKIDIKIISATNADLKQAVQQGKFRSDLYYRLNVVELVLPPLKQRGEDIVILAEKLLAKHCLNMGRTLMCLSDNARKCLLEYQWPGNVRELNNEMERAAALAMSEIVEVKDLSAKLSLLYDQIGFINDSASTEGELLMQNRSNFNLSKIEQQVIKQALESTGGNKTKASALLGISREGLRKKLLRFNDQHKQ